MSTFLRWRLYDQRWPFIKIKRQLFTVLVYKVVREEEDIEFKGNKMFVCSPALGALYLSLCLAFNISIAVLLAIRKKLRCFFAFALVSRVLQNNQKTHGFPYDEDQAS